MTVALERMKTGKAPGPDGIPGVVVATVTRTFPDTLLKVYNACLQQGTFGAPWKRQRLVLIPKVGSTGSPSGYRPLCMLNVFGKILENMILHRLRPFLENRLSDRQYGFRRGRSTIDAVSHVVRIIRTAWGSGPAGKSKNVVMVALDVKNAFNSARWNLILSALEERFRVPRYLMVLLESYFSGRVLEYGTNDARSTRNLSSGVPQGSVLGPTLWNAMYDELLEIELPDDSTIVAYADDIAVMISGKSPAELQQRSNEALRRVGNWLRSAGLQLAVHKTEAIFFTRRRNPQLPELRLEGVAIPYANALRYLGVWLDRRLRFNTHIEKASAKAAVTSEQLARLMPNIGGPKTSRRKLLSGVVHSTLLYGAPIWANRLLAVKTYQRKMARVQRKSALRVIAAYRTVSGDATMVIAATPPVDLLAAEREARYGGEERKEAREKLMEKWQRRWNAAKHGRWTHRLIGDLLPWCDRKHGHLNYHVTQLLSGHGCFGTYLERIKKEATQRCHHCDAMHDDAEHTIFVCPAWEAQRADLRTALGGQQLSVSGMIPSMLKDTDQWTAWEDFAAAVVSAKEDAERERRMRERGFVESPV